MIMVIGPHKKKAEAKAEQRKRRPDEVVADGAEDTTDAVVAAPQETAQA
jgi:translation initiation factor IF-3